MRKALHILMLLIVGVMMACRSNHYEATGDASCRFNIVVSPYDGQIEGKAADLQPITTLIAAIYDDKGVKVDKHVAINYATDLSQIDIEGLRDGSYTIAFFAIGEQRTPVQITPPSTLDGGWIPQSPSDQNTYNEYLSATTPFVMSGGQCETKNVTLRHVVSAITVNVDVNYPNWPGGEVDSINLEFVGALFATNHTPNGAYTGHAQQSMKVGTTHQDFYLLPASTPDKIIGHATIIGKYSDGRECRIEREFEINVVANKRQVVNINFATSDADNLGLIRFYDVDRAIHRSRKVWQDGCDKSEYLNGQKFYPTKPIQVVMDAKNNTLISTLYGGVALRDVTVLIRRQNDAEFFELAWFESINAFEERTIDFSANQAPKLYRTESGKLVSIDGLKSMNGVEIKYKSEEPFIKKIQTITWPGYIIFNNGVPICDPGTDPPDTKNSTTNQAVAVRPVYVREAMAMYTNVGYVISSQKWRDRMLESEKEEPFTNDGTNPVSFTGDILPRMMRTTNLTLSIINPKWDYRLNGVANVGNGDYFSLREYVLTSHYTDWVRIDTFYHEYCHTLGFGHSGNLTYGKFCEQTGQFHLSMIPELPYNNASTLHSWDNKTRYGG